MFKYNYLYLSIFFSTLTSLIIPIIVTRRFDFFVSEQIFFFLALSNPIQLFICQDLRKQLLINSDLNFKESLSTRYTQCLIFLIISLFLGFFFIDNILIVLSFCLYKSIEMYRELIHAELQRVGEWMKMFIFRLVSFVVVIFAFIIMDYSKVYGLICVLILLLFTSIFEGYKIKFRPVKILLNRNQLTLGLASFLNSFSTNTPIYFLKINPSNYISISNVAVILVFLNGIYTITSLHFSVIIEKIREFSISKRFKVSLNYQLLYLLLLITGVYIFTLIDGFNYIFDLEINFDFSLMLLLVITFLAISRNIFYTISHFNLQAVLFSRIRSIYVIVAFLFIFINNDFNNFLMLISLILISEIILNYIIIEK